MTLDSKGPSKHEYRPANMTAGPHQLGDPDDLSLRRIEKSVLIPEHMRNKARKEMCKDINIAFARCCRDNGVLMSFKCQEESQNLKKCVQTWFNDPEFKKQCTKEYLADRSEYRRTGIGKKEREAMKAEENARAQS